MINNVLCISVENHRCILFWEEWFCVGIWNKDFVQNGHISNNVSNLASVRKEI